MVYRMISKDKLKMKNMTRRFGSTQWQLTVAM